MSKMMIKDLTESKELSRESMATLRGGSWGYGYGYDCGYFGYPFSVKNVDKSKTLEADILQSLNQDQSNQISNASGSAFVENATVYSDPSQYGKNQVKIYQ